ncbi:MAG TPA: tyrosine-type recombinase/integrase [Urbifossiella sp.]|jgi:site-specific recombinase XerD|nr:tyrosine-type recombinase/integrase [Urbifossiella sp.]
MPRRPGVYFSRGHFVTKFGCGDGPPIKLAPATCKSDRDAKQVAEAELRRLVVERDQTRTAPKPVSQVTVEDLVVKFLERTKADCQPATHHDYAAMLRKLVYGFPWKPVPWKKSLPRPDPSHVRVEPFTDGLGGVRAREVPAVAVQEMRNALARRYKPKTVNNWLIACKACWNWAVRMKLLADNPFAGFEPLYAPGRTRVCTPDEFDRLLAGTDDTFRPVLLFLRHTPARPGVVAHLRCEDLDAEFTQAVMHKTKRSSTSRVKEPWRIPIAERLRPVLRELVERGGGRGHVFLNEDGRPWTKDALALRFRRLRERVGITPDSRGEKLVLYSNRHTYLTKAAPHVSAAMLAVFADHTDPRTTRRYLHFSPEEIAAAGEKVAQNLN